MIWLKSVFRAHVLADHSTTENENMKAACAVVAAFGDDQENIFRLSVHLTLSKQETKIGKAEENGDDRALGHGRKNGLEKGSISFAKNGKTVVTRRFDESFRYACG